MPRHGDTAAALNEGSPAGRAAQDVVVLSGVTKTYGRGRGRVVALDSVSLGIRGGRFLAVMGPSGSGKSTLLHCAAGLDVPTAGQVTIAGVETSRLSETRRTVLRRQRVGFVFQAYNLLPSLDTEQNITLPLRLAGTRPDRAWLRMLVRRVGLDGHLRRRPAELSGGQQQRAAIARALAGRPEVVFADEPTGALDLRTAKEVLGLLRELVDDLGQTVVMVTHDPVAASFAHEVAFLADGRLAGSLSAPAPEQVAERLTRLGEW